MWKATSDVRLTADSHPTPDCNRLMLPASRRFDMRHIAMPIALIMFASVMSAGAHGQEHKAINVGSAHGLPFSDGILAGNTLYVAGQEGDDASGQLVPGGISAETKVALANVEKVLKAAGFRMKDIVSVTVFLADINDFAAMNKIYRDVMADPKPVRSTIQAAALVDNARIEIAVIAVK
jgi:2-iminobutanoate/2-iminopropanoate deaminase